MKISVLTAHDCKTLNPQFQELINITLPNKEKYCKKHQYLLRISDSHDILPNKFNFRTNHECHIYKLLVEELEKEEAEWLCWMDPDVLIMNQTISLESFIDNTYDFIIGEDWNGINTGVFFLKINSKTLDFINKCIDYEPTEFDKTKTPFWWWPSAQCAYTRNMHNINTLIVHHSLFNGYIKRKDSQNTWPGWNIGPFNPNWQERYFQHGDFILHLVGDYVQNKIINANIYTQKVIQ